MTEWKEWTGGYAHHLEEEDVKNIMKIRDIFMQHINKDDSLRTGSNIVMAGGALRDMVTGKGIKDIDLYISIPDRNIAFAVASQVKKVFNAVGGSSGEGMPDLYGMFKIDVQPHPIDVMFLQPKTNVWEYMEKNFDLPICQIGKTLMTLDTIKQVWMHPNAYDDFSNRRITYTKDVPRSGKMVGNRFVWSEHVKRICRKYKDWAFEVNDNGY